MNNKILAAGLIAVTATVIGFYPEQQTPAHATTLVQPIQKPKIQIAILLDTSSSMSGLIDQTRNQLWQVVNEFSRAKRQGVNPDLEVAIYEYGNNSLSPENGYVRQVSALTSELDQVSEALFSLNTNGGNEYCGYAIHTSLSELAWSQSDNDIKAIFIAGNEPFSQGPVSYKTAINKARSMGVTVNTIHAGNRQTGIQGGWQQGAQLAGGDFMSIDHNHRVAHITTPHDEKLNELNTQLNQTYVPYGKEGRTKLQRQSRQDKESESISPALMAKRTQSKASSLYNNSSWDLIDAITKGDVKLKELSEAQLPDKLKNMDKAQQEGYLKKKTAERKEIKEKIKQLSDAREKFVAEKKSELSSAGVNTVNDAVSASIRKLGNSKNYEFEKK